MIGFVQLLYEFNSLLHGEIDTDIMENITVIHAISKDA